MEVSTSLVYISVSTKIIDHLVRICVGTNSLGLKDYKYPYLYNAVKASSNIGLAELHRHRRILIVTEQRNPYIAYNQIEHKADRQHDGQEEETKRAAAATARFTAAALRASFSIAALLLRAGNYLLRHFLLLLLSRSSLLLFLNRSSLLLLLNGGSLLLLHLHLRLLLCFRILLISLLCHSFFVQKD